MKFTTLMALFLIGSVIAEVITACGVNSPDTEVIEQHQRCINCGGDGDPIAYGQAYTAEYINRNYSGVNVNQADVVCNGTRNVQECEFSFRFGGGQVVRVTCVFDLNQNGDVTNVDCGDYM